MGVLTDIKGALDAHLQTLTSHWPVKWPGLTFDPKSVANQRYYKVTFAPANPPTLSLRGEDKFREGLYSIICVGDVQTMSNPLIDEAERVANHFPYLTTLSTASGPVEVTAKPFVAQLIELPHELQVPVTINWALNA